MIDSRAEEENAARLAEELVELFKKCAMKVVKFYSNSPLVLAEVAEELRLPET